MANEPCHPFSAQQCQKQLDRIERKIDGMDSKLDKVDRISAVHGVKIQMLQDESKMHKTRIWTVIVLVIGGGVTAAWAAITGK